MNMLASFVPARQGGRLALLLLAPAMLLLALLLLVPLGAVFGLSFTDYTLGGHGGYVGLGNYRALVADRVFWTSLGNTLLYAVVVVPFSFGLGLATALLIQAGTGLRAYYRTACFLPVMASLLATSMAWEFMLHPDFGLVNELLRWLGLPGRNWLHDAATALPVLMVIGIWQQFGFCMVLFLAGLTAVPPVLYEAAALDGAACAWSRFCLVTWPMLGPVSLFVALISVIHAFQVFDTVHVLTGGGPGKATEVLLETIYTEGFVFFRTGRACAVTMVFVVLVFAISFLKRYVLERRVHYA